MKKLKLAEKKKVSKIFLLVSMLLMAISLPITAKLVKQNQENRSNAASKTSVSKPYLYFNTTKSSVKVGKTFKLTVRVNSFSEVISFVDVIGNYDASIMELVSIEKVANMIFGKKGNCVTDSSSVGVFSATCYSDASTSGKKVKGDLLVLTFKAKAAGKSEITFKCKDGETIDSNIVKASTGSDLIVCNQNKTNIVTITETVTSRKKTSVITGDKEGQCGVSGVVTSKPLTSVVCLGGSSLSGKIEELSSDNGNAISYSWFCGGVGFKLKFCSAIQWKVTREGQCGVSGVVTSKPSTSVCIGGSSLSGRIENVAGSYNGKNYVGYSWFCGGAGFKLKHCTATQWIQPGQCAVGGSVRSVPEFSSASLCSGGSVLIDNNFAITPCSSYNGMNCNQYSWHCGGTGFVSKYCPVYVYSSVTR